MTKFGSEDLQSQGRETTPIGNGIFALMWPPQLLLGFLYRYRYCKSHNFEEAALHVGTFSAVRQHVAVVVRPPDEIATTLRTPVWPRVNVHAFVLAQVAPVDERLEADPTLEWPFTGVHKLVVVPLTLRQESLVTDLTRVRLDAECWSMWWRRATRR